ncbi:MAG: MerR family DNA-binding protein [Bryobacteraceae bacterium]|nr:MerR family DNA-binding protein [Solibacteraceae bacterium]MCO5351977.1 MerR family DNA-binding protein [Bryobacteraceae bacterium]
MAKPRTISRAAREAEVSVETIRYYERLGLLARRRGPGYRIYTDEEIATLRLIRRSQRFGFTLSEIRELLALLSSDAATCDDVCVRAERKLDEIEAKMRELSAIRDMLKRSLACRNEQRRARECTMLAGDQ